MNTSNTRLYHCPVHNNMPPVAGRHVKLRHHRLLLLLSIEVLAALLLQVSVAGETTGNVDRPALLTHRMCGLGAAKITPTEETDAR